MSTFWAGVIVGAMVGVAVGIIVMALAAINGREGD